MARSPRPTRSRAASTTSSRSLVRRAHSPVAPGLQGALASTFRIYRDTHLIHFNLHGPYFPQLHLLLDGQYKEVWSALDVIGERIRGMGDRVRPAAFQAKPFEVPDDARTAIQLLAEENRAVSKEWTQLFSVCDEADDQGTADLCADRIRAHDQHAWMLEVTLEGWPTASGAPARRRGATIRYEQPSSP